MVWKLDGNEPVYEQIMDTIRGAVLTGEYAPGQKIPSVRDLAVMAHVNPNTMQHAMQELERTGLVIAVGTSGRFVTRDVSILEKIRESHIRKLTVTCAEKFAQLGVSASQAAQLLLQYENEKEA